MVFVCHPKILHKHCLQFLLGVKMAPRETEDNAYAKFWDDKQKVLWYVMVFSGVVNSANTRHMQISKCEAFWLALRSLVTFRLQDEDEDEDEDQIKLNVLSR